LSAPRPGLILALVGADSPRDVTFQGGNIMLQRTCFALVGLLLASVCVPAEEKTDWEVLFNGKDTAGWKLRAEKLNVTKFVDEDGKVVPGARKGKVEQKEIIVDAKDKQILNAKVEVKDGKTIVVDSTGTPIEGAKVVKTGGRDAIIDKEGKELKGVKAVNELVDNPSGWTVEDGVLVSSKPHGGNDLVSEQTFTDFELHVEFLGTANSGVYLQGRYEIQIDNSFGAKPKIVEKDGQKIEEFDTHQCGAIYGRIAPKKNMAKPPKEWQTYDVTFRGARKDGDKMTKARVTLIWNGEKVIDDAEIDGPTGGALDGKVAEPGPVLLQGDHGKVSFRNIKIRPLAK
jgi:Domain of Unknown Function (DUF1080)